MHAGYNTFIIKPWGPRKIFNVLFFPLYLHIIFIAGLCQGDEFRSPWGCQLTRAVGEAADGDRVLSSKAGLSDILIHSALM